MEQTEEGKERFYEYSVGYIRELAALTDKWFEWFRTLKGEETMAYSFLLSGMETVRVELQYRYSKSSDADDLLELEEELEKGFEEEEEEVEEVPGVKTVFLDK